MKSMLRLAEGGIASIALLAMAFLPIAEAGMRLVFGIGIPGSFPFVQHLTLWVTFLGAALAAREGRLLSLATGDFLPEGIWQTSARVFAAAVGAGVSILLCRASIDLIVIERQAGTMVAAFSKIMCSLPCCVK